MVRPIIIDPAAPMASLREAAGLTLTALATARGVKPQSQVSAEGAGDRVQLSTLLAAAKAAGLIIEIRVRQP